MENMQITILLVLFHCQIMTMAIVWSAVGIGKESDVYMGSLDHVQITIYNTCTHLLGLRHSFISEKGERA
jgi:hypothetical protein